MDPPRGAILGRPTGEGLQDSKGRISSSKGNGNMLTNDCALRHGRGPQKILPTSRVTTTGSPARSDCRVGPVPTKNSLLPTNIDLVVFRPARSSSFHRSAACTIATTAARRSHTTPLPVRRSADRSALALSSRNPSDQSGSERVSARRSYAALLMFEAAHFRPSTYQIRGTNGVFSRNTRAPRRELPRSINFISRAISDVERSHVGYAGSGTLTRLCVNETP